MSGSLLAALPFGAAAQSATAAVSVGATVSPSVVLKFEGSSAPISISNQDIARGYIDLPGTYRLTVDAGKSVQQIANVVLDFEPEPNVFKSIEVASWSGERSGHAAGSFVADYINALPATAAGPGPKPRNDPKSFGALQRVSVRGATTSIDYRLVLADNAKPGNISVPLTLNIQL
jgi:hypothetical protein